MQKKPWILGIDRWSKYIGLAYLTEPKSIPLPIGYILNDSMTLYSITDVIANYNIKTIVFWYPAKQEDIQEKITKFMESLLLAIDSEKIAIEKIEEDYTSVQSGEILSNFKKSAAEDTVSAMVILERRQKHSE